MQITKELAQQAARDINRYLGNWPNTESVYRGEHVAALEGVEAKDGSMLWLAQFDSDIPALLIETDRGGQVYLARSQSFFRSELYPAAQSGNQVAGATQQEVEAGV